MGIERSSGTPVQRRRGYVRDGRRRMVGSHGRAGRGGPAGRRCAGRRLRQGRRDPVQLRQAQRRRVSPHARRPEQRGRHRRQRDHLRTRESDQWTSIGWCLGACAETTSLLQAFTYFPWLPGQGGVKFPPQPAASPGEAG